MKQYILFLRNNWPLLAFGFTSIFWGNFGQSFFVSWYGASIQESLGLSAAAYGSLYSGGTLGSALTIIAIGGLIDKWPLQRFTAIVACGLMLACVLMMVSAHALTLLIAFYLLRLCGQGLLPHTAQTTMARYFDADRGKALSLSSSGVPVGEVVLPLVAVALIAGIGWRGSWLVFAASVPLLYLPLSLWLLRRSPQIQQPNTPASRAGTEKAQGRREMLGDYRFWLALPAVLTPPFLVTGVFIQQGFILNQKGWDPLWLASCFIVYGIAHWLAALLAGVLIDLFSARKLLPFMLTPLVLALLSLVYLDGNWVAPLFMCLLGTTIGIAGPLTGALWAEVYGTEKLGSIRSLMTAFMVLSTAVSPILFGALIDRGASLQSLFGTSALCAVLASVVVIFSYPRQTLPG
ncbi:MFS transporter [Gilvimarinus sp. SDUM040013]|uniref:MFS transporter n=1 Tax=Gilvimarinus gilvus TaxID=3058038 RepID=A0ABU4RWN1_9GAMM|nr:MFS transporter [Gilvimarinus sp. SDUM040013]MDO3386488.1 MFS transporter [Gilvimarinus sp. SDUM040013]MDX6849064.1 MFS transporter [Gilvimarinus sp. SDUM040013]